MENLDHTPESKSKPTPQPKCGIVMPISPIDGCGIEHWQELLSIFKDSISNAGFESNLVSDADDSGIIQKRIIQNLYNSEVVVCDVSCKNPNVMFELGIRLAFDKPTIIVKDDQTDYSFDTAIIEHLTYPRDLRFGKIITFKENLAKKIKSTYEKANADPQYSTFLKNFGEYKVTNLNTSEISKDNFILSSLNDIQETLKQIKTAPKSFPDKIATNDRLLFNNFNVNKTLGENLSILLKSAIDEFLTKNEFRKADILKSSEIFSQLVNYIRANNIDLDYVSDEFIRRVVYDILDMTYAIAK